jgi:hypothetical protein
VKDRGRRSPYRSMVATTVLIQVAACCSLAVLCRNETRRWSRSLYLVWGLCSIHIPSPSFVLSTCWTSVRACYDRQLWRAESWAAARHFRLRGPLLSTATLFMAGSGFSKHHYPGSILRFAIPLHWVCRTDMCRVVKEVSSHLSLLRKLRASARFLIKVFQPL